MAEESVRINLRRVRAGRGQFAGREDMLDWIQQNVN
jgi:hypothetical protein